MTRSITACSAWFLFASACAATGRGPPEAPPRVPAQSPPAPAPVIVRDRPVDDGPRFDRASMQLDLDMWLSEMEAAHPDPYTRIDREAFHARVRTLLEADVSTARFVRADGDVTNKEPVMPDIVVHQSIEEWLRHEDPILRRALTWIATGR